ncbi:NTP transferase domain-containing protein [Cohnella yongneupensis]|uniref:NTP transferase domain-containing protein n=1 Tax=Cohnella yongneupensis TaxID=425006 RepID=A0ABW0R151_9BACL
MMMMKALILTAGKGSRLRPYTDHCPKGMIEVEGKTILERQIELFHSLGITEIGIVKGYKAESVKTPPEVVHYINEEYDTTNMAQTLLCAESFFDDEVIVSYSDILYHRSVLEALLDCKHVPAVVVDQDWKPYFAERFGNPFEDAESLELNEANHIVSIGKPSPDPHEIQAQYIGLMKFNVHTMQHIKLMLSQGEQASIGWGRPPRQCYLTDVIQQLVYDGLELKAVKINGGWLEIDTARDYELAKRLFPQRIAYV